MSKPKQIAWESWSARVEDIMSPKDITLPEIDASEANYSEIEIPVDFFPPEMFLQQQRVL